MPTEPTPKTLKAAKKWSVNQRKLMLWLALPSEEREPLTQRALAQQLKVHEVTLSGWTKLPGFMQEVQTLITESLGDAYHDVMAALKKKATSGSFPHQKMYLEMLGVYVPKIAPVTPDGLREWLAGIADADIDTEIIGIVDKARTRATRATGARTPLPVDDASTP